MAELSNPDITEPIVGVENGVEPEIISVETIESSQPTEGYPVVESLHTTVDQAAAVRATRAEVEEVLHGSEQTKSAESLIVRDEYYLEKEKILFPKGFIESHPTSYEKYGPNRKGLADKISSIKYISNFKKWGIKEPKAFYKVLYERGFNLKDLTMDSVAQYADMNPAAIGKAVDRIEKFGFEVGYRLSKPESKALIEKMAAVPDENFDKFAAEINQYPFLDRGLTKDHSGLSRYFIESDSVYEHGICVRTDVSVNPIFKKFLESAENGQLDPEVKLRLDLLRECKMLGEAEKRDLWQNENFYYSELHSSARNGGRGFQNDILDIFDTDSAMLFELPDANNRDSKMLDREAGFIWQNAEHIYEPERFIRMLSSEQIAALPNDQNGAACFMKEVLSLVESRNQHDMVKKIIKSRDKIQASFRDESEKAAFLAELVGAGYNGLDIPLALSSLGLSKIGELVGTEGPLPDFLIEALYVNDVRIDNLQYFAEKAYDSFSDQDKMIYQIYKQSDDLRFRQLVREKKEDLTGLFDENYNPSGLFLDILVARGADINNYHFSVENLSDEDKFFWAIFQRDAYISPLLRNSLLQSRYSIAENYNPDMSIKLPYLQFLLNDGGASFNASGFITEDFTRNRPEAERPFWEQVAQLPYGEKTFLICHCDEYQKYLEGSGDSLTSDFYHDYLLSYELVPQTKVSEEAIAKFSSKSDQEFWTMYNSINQERVRRILLEQKDASVEYFANGRLNKDFFDMLKNEHEQEFKDLLIQDASKEDWSLVFGAETVRGFLKALPDDEVGYERNAFTHTTYDRVSPFFGSLVGKGAESGFELTTEGLKVATEYVKNFGLSETPVVFRFFKAIREYEQGKLEQLPQECVDSGVTNLDQLKNQIDTVKKQCVGHEPLDNLELSPMQLDLLSVATGHSNNRWTRVPIDKIVSEFSAYLGRGDIAPLAPEFQSASATVNKTETKNTVDLESNQIFTLLKNELLASVDNLGSVEDLVTQVKDIFDRKIAALRVPKEGVNDFTIKQTGFFNTMIEKVDQVKTIDEMLKTLVPMTMNLGGGVEFDEQANYNSVLRQLVFRRVLERHSASNFTERLYNSLSNNPGSTAVWESLNFMDNLVKDHALNLETNNDEKYWDPETFAEIKKYVKVFKKNLNVGTFTKELESIYKKFEVTTLDASLNIEAIPDRGLTGELAGYMADVCYTKVYPLLKTYPNVVPYKFVASPETENPEIIGSTLVFQVDTAEGEPALLIRAFDIPSESSIDVGTFFEEFADSLTETAKKLGVKKILAAGTGGTISNYVMTTSHVTSKYVSNKTSTPLKETFNFNGYNITNDCYMVRDID